MSFIAMDFETASRHPESACSLVPIMIRNNKIIDCFYAVINPQMSFGGRNIQVHQITPDNVRGTPTVAEVWPKIKALYQPEILVTTHNAGFDANILKMSLARYGIDEPHYLVVDTLKTSRLLEPDLPNHKLNTVARVLGAELWHHHSALSDSGTCARILIKQSKKVGDEAIESLIEQR